MAVSEISMELLKIIVGERFDSSLPDEAFSINIVNGSPLMIFNFDVSDTDISNFLNGQVSFGLFSDQDMIFFLFKIENFMEWSDLAFTIHLAGDETIEVHDSYLMFNLVLIESETKIVKAIRAITVTPDFRAKIAEAIKQQALIKFETINYYKGIGEMYDKYPTASDMLKFASVVEVGGTTV